MYQGVKYKFTQNENLKKELLATEGSELIEKTRSDSFWGDAPDGSGKNMLGKVLMRLRKEFKDEKS